MGINLLLLLALLGIGKFVPMAQRASETLTIDLLPSSKDAASKNEQQQQKPIRIALTGADVEYSRNALEGARENARAMGFEIVYDRMYPPSTAEFRFTGA